MGEQIMGRFVTSLKTCQGVIFVIGSSLFFGGGGGIIKISQTFANNVAFAEIPCAHIFFKIYFHFPCMFREGTGWI